MVRLLVVEDCFTVSSVLKFALEAEGFQAEIARDAITALEKVRTWHPDAIILDINLPGLSGFDVAKKIRETDEFKGIPIIMVSAMDQEANVSRAASLGVAAYLPKPIHMDELLAEIKRALG